MRSVPAESPATPPTPLVDGRAQLDAATYRAFFDQSPFYAGIVGVDGTRSKPAGQCASERMDRLIQDVLVYSRISRNEILVERIDLGAFVSGILESYPQFSAANADFEIVRPLDPVLANSAALTQCISNLLGNAIKFVAPNVKPAIRLWTERAGGRVKIFVQDNGVGIDEKVHEKIFGIFYQVDARRGGTGIGLSVVRKAAERMGGSVSLRSVVGNGSTFVLELPAAPRP